MFVLVLISIHTINYGQFIFKYSNLLNMINRNKDTALGFKVLYDRETGEEFTCHTVTKTLQTDKDFYKIWLVDLFHVLEETLGGAKMKVISYILKNISPYDNTFGGTVREIAENAKVSSKTVQDSLTILLTRNFFKKIRNSQYMVNPDLMIKGGSRKRQGLLITYKGLQESPILANEHPPLDNL